MKIGIITGSHRSEAESARVGQYIEKLLAAQGVASYLLSLSGNPLPLWDEGVWESSEKWQKLWSPIASNLRECTSFIIISPEWGGMVPPALKNFFLLCSTAEVGHKPALIVAVSSGVGGAYVVSELRTSSYKNNRLCYLPEHVIIRGVEAALKSETAENTRDTEIRGRIKYGVDLLKAYDKALATVRESGVIDHKNFPFGM